MKKTILFSALMLCVALANAQVTVSLVVDEALSEVTVTEFETINHGTVTNLAMDSKTYKWERILNNKPTEWQSAICDLNQCYLPATNSKEFVLASNANGLLDVHIRPNGVAGSAEVQLRVSEVGNDNNNVVGVYLFESTTGTEDVLRPTTNIFPNPVQANFAIINGEAVKTVIVYNLLGQSVKHFTANNGLYDVASLATGTYLVAMLDSEQRIIKTVRMNKL